MPEPDVAKLLKVCPTGPVFGAGRSLKKLTAGVERSPAGMIFPAYGTRPALEVSLGEFGLKTCPEPPARYSLRLQSPPDVQLDFASAVGTVVSTELPVFSRRP